MTSDGDVVWPDGEPERLARRYEALLARPLWRDLVLAHLSDPCGTGPYGFNVALFCAGHLDMPVLPQALRHLEREPFNAYAWQWAVNHSDSETITSVITLAMRVLPLDVLAGGPADSQGFGPEHAPDRALEATSTAWTSIPGSVSNCFGSPCPIEWSGYGTVLFGR
ncbi:hypothetical protein GCM10023191_078620 [Actinoallomurus oryzae]|uniref:Uncharacterized protein n=1 Tax=Actinoallomurus oryzae TaxID=502180 RepID=A0ABP8QXI6_9ACTN